MSIGLEIAIEKTEETDASVRYRYVVREGRGGLVVPAPTERAGCVALDKSTGEVHLDTPSPDDPEGVLFARVAAALRRHWRAGEYPAKTGWAG